MSFSERFADLTTTFTGSSGVNTGLDFQGMGLKAGQTFRVVGATSLASLTTGLNAGTAGAGTTSTSIVKPTGSANLTANDAVGKWFKRTGGGGYVVGGDNLRPVLSNTTTAFAINTMSGCDSTTTFEIVDLATTASAISASDLLAIRAAGCSGTIEIYGLDFSTSPTLDGLIEVSDCSDVIVRACKLSQNTANPTVSITRCQRVRVEHCRLTSSADIEITRCNNVAITGCVNSAGGVVEIEDCNFVDVTKLTAASAPSRVLSITRAAVATVEAACSSGGATPIYLEAVDHMSAVGGLITGTGNTGYGLEIAFSGQYNITGCSITGTTGDVLFDNNACTWSNHFGTSYGRVATATMGAIAQTVPTMTIVYGASLFNNEVYFSSRVLFYGIFNPPQFTGITATGSVSGDAYQLPAGEYYGVSTVAAGTGVKFHNASALPGPRIIVYNSGANTLTLYPTSGTINGAASVTLAAGAIAIFLCVDFGTDKWMQL